MTLNRNFSDFLLIFSVENDYLVQHCFICACYEVQLNRGVRTAEYDKSSYCFIFSKIKMYGECLVLR
jgi:hypothetical protein